MQKIVERDCFMDLWQSSEKTVSGLDLEKECGNGLWDWPASFYDPESGYLLCCLVLHHQVFRHLPTMRYKSLAKLELSSIMKECITQQVGIEEFREDWS